MNCWLVFQSSFPWQEVDCLPAEPKFTLLGRARRDLFPFCPSSYRVTVVLATRESDPSQQPPWRSTRMSSLVTPIFMFIPSFFVSLNPWSGFLSLLNFSSRNWDFLTILSSNCKKMIPGDELFSDTYPMKLVDDCIYEVYGKVRLGAV